MTATFPLPKPLRTGGFAFFPPPVPGGGESVETWFICSESDVQLLASDNVFHTPGIYYRPKELKSIKCYLGASETKNIYRNFEINNLNSNAADYTHHLYTRYLQYQRFIPPNETNYFAHTFTNVLPEPPSTTTGKGCFNVFPLSLTSEELNKTTSTALGNHCPGFVLDILKTYLLQVLCQKHCWK